MKIDKNYLIVVLISLLAVFVVVPGGSLFGSTTDWLAQHIVFPEYFRNLFYETHDLFPSLALNIGGGQNIYYFSYYGLLNPIILLSYLFPFVDMAVYLIVVNILLYVVFGIFMYKWLNNRFNNSLSLLLTIIALFASPILFHFHRHYMFVSYIPFLILALIGVDKYIENSRGSLLIFSVFMIIMMSYYYSITCIIVLVIYYLYRYISMSENICFKKMCGVLLKFLVPIFISVLMSAVLLVPTFLTLINGRDTGNAVGLLELMLPKLNIDSIVYGSYTIGLTAIAVLSLLCMFISKKRENRFLSVLLFVIITVPLFIYILNGTLYIRDKILIPFIPLFVILIGEFLKSIFDKDMKLFKIIFISLFTSLLFIIFGYHNWIYYVEILFILLFIFLYYKKNIKVLFVSFLLLSSFISFDISNREDEYVSFDLYNDLYRSDKISDIEDVAMNEDEMVRYSDILEHGFSINRIYNLDFYSTSVYSSSSNSFYKNFYTNIFKNSLSHRNDLMLSANSNIFYQMFMGIKYIYSDYGMSGYRELRDNIYVNDDVLPMFYVAYNTLDDDAFSEIAYPYNMEALLKNVIVSNGDFGNFESNIVQYDLGYTYDDNPNLSVMEFDNMYYVNVNKDVNLKLKLDKVLTDEILILSFRLNNQHNCSEGDSEIIINNVSNKLTCKRELYQNNNYVFHYVISSNKVIDSLDIVIKKGLYVIDDIKSYIVSYDDIRNVNNDVTAARINNDLTSGDVIVLDVEAFSDGYFVTSIPYDTGYQVFVDGKEVKYEKVNTSFIGFKISKGYHDIKIVYAANGLFIGKIISFIGIICFFVFVFVEKRMANK